MIMQIYSVRDNAVAAFLQPFFAPTNASAIRSLTEAVEDVQHQFHKHASDYSLWNLGEFDDSSGVITTGGPERIIALIDLKKPIGFGV